MKKLVCMVLVVLMVVMAFAGCAPAEPAETGSSAPTEESPEVSDSTAPEETGSSEAEGFEATLAGKGEGLVVGLSMGDLSSTYIVSASQYFKKLMEAAGAEVQIVNCDNNVSLQSDQIRDFINMDVDIIAVHANDAVGVAPAVNEAIEAGIPVVGFNKTVEGADLSFAVYSSDNVATGAKAAQWLADKAEELGVKNPKVAVMQGTMTASDAYERQDGIEQVAEETGMVLLNEPCDWLADSAESALNDVLTANPDLFGIITHCDSMVPGVISALNQQGLAVDASDENHIYFAGIDGDPTGLDALNSGIMDAGIEQNPLQLATVIAKGCLEVVAKGETLNGEIIIMETAQIDKSMTGDSQRWATYDPETATELWAGTEETWNAFLTDY